MSNVKDKKATITIDDLKGCHKSIIEHGKIAGNQELMESIEWKAYVVDFYKCEKCVSKLNNEILKWRG